MLKNLPSMRTLWVNYWNLSFNEIREWISNVWALIDTNGHLTDMLKQLNKILVRYIKKKKWKRKAIINSRDNRRFSKEALSWHLTCNALYLHWQDDKNTNYWFEQKLWCSCVRRKGNGKVVLVVCVKGLNPQIPWQEVNK